MLFMKYFVKAAVLIITLVLPKETQHTGRAPIQHLGIHKERRLRRRRGPEAWEYRVMAFPLRRKKQSEEGGLIYPSVGNFTKELPFTEPQCGRLPDRHSEA